MEEGGGLVLRLDRYTHSVTNHSPATASVKYRLNASPLELRVV